MKIYMAGPLFTIAKHEFNAKLKALLCAYGHEVYMIQDDKDVDTNDSHELFWACVNGVKYCDVVVANMDQPDPYSGTCFECGFAFEKKPIVIYRTDFRKSGDAGGGMVNLMLTESADFQIAGYAGMRIETLAGYIQSALDSLEANKIG